MFRIKKLVMENINFGFQNAQKIDPIPLSPKDFNVANVLNLYDIHIREELPKVDENEMIINDNYIEEHYVKIIVNNLRNIYNKMPTFEIPPLFNKQMIDELTIIFRKVLKKYYCKVHHHYC